MGGLHKEFGGPKSDKLLVPPRWHLLSHLVTLYAMRHTFRMPLMFAVLLLGCTTLGAQDRYKQARELFLRAYERVNVEATERRQADGDELRTYPLYPYLQAARLRRELRDAGDSFATIDRQIETFLGYYGNEPVTRDLRRTWLDSLADRELWALYLDHYRNGPLDDTQRCRSLTARLALQTPQDAANQKLAESLTAEIIGQWLTPRSVPECERPFDWLRARNSLTPELIEQRARLALGEGNHGFARQIIAMLPAAKAEPLQHWAALLANPRGSIDAAIAGKMQSVEPAALLDGWTRFARRDRSRAKAHFAALMRSQKFDKPATSPYALALALALSWDRDPEALEYFAKVEPKDFDDSALEWQTRAALWAQDWPLVARSIAAMSGDARQSARWRYWAARAAEKRNDSALARQLYASVLPDDNYYSAMAAARLAEPVRPHPRKLPRDDTLLNEIQQFPAVVRAHELLLCGLRLQANSEWQYGYDSLSEEARSQLIHLAVSWGWYDQAVATASQRKVFFDYELLYPQPYDKEVKAGARLTKLQPELIYGVLRQESLYRADATSAAGARGLLQMVPETARRTARKWGKPRPSLDDLHNPAVNVPLGAAQLRTLVDRFAGQTAVALAGYNAGPNAARRWLPDEAIDPDIWVENIPYNETRNYVQRVLWHSIVFAWLRSGEPQLTQSWLARIAPPGAAIAVGSM